ncbi:MAG: LysR family transcriptional regulator [Pirellulales bacterium]|nr:LysR family transcriptional regulator [Pirellulales bacterium]
MKPRVKVWLELDGDYVFGFGLSNILKAVEATGSIKAGALQLGKSYRYVWGRIKKAEKALGQPLVETHVGGKGTSRSFLTDFAGRLVREYDALRGRVLEVVDQEYPWHIKSALRINAQQSQSPE